MMDPRETTPYMAWAMDLAARYCAETDLPPEVAQHVAHLLGQGWGEDFSRVPATEQPALEKCYADSYALNLWLWDLWRFYSPAVETKQEVLMHVPPAFLPTDERAVIVAYTEHAAKGDDSGYPNTPYWEGVQERSPSCVAHLRAWESFRERVLVREEELRAYLRRYVRETTGKTEWPWPDEWLKAGAAPLARLHDLSAGCMHLAEANYRKRAEEAERQAREDRAALEKERQRNRDLRAGLSDRVMLPGQLITSGYSITVFSGTVRAIDQHELFTDDISEPLLRAGAEAVVEQSQLAALAPVQTKAVVGVYRLFTSRGDDGRELLGTPLWVPARLAYQAAGVRSTRDKSRRAMFEGFRAASAHKIHVALRGAYEDGSPYVVGDRVPLFEMRPVWSASTDNRRRMTAADADHLARAWAQLKADDPWEERLPDGYVFTLPPIMRKIWHRLVLGGDTLDRLENGAKLIRGAGEGFTRLDWRLFIEITQTVQYGQLTNDRERFKSYVEPFKILADVYGQEKIDHARARGKLTTTYLAQYNKALAVMEAGDLAQVVERNYRTSDGELRDVLAINPAVMLNHESRLERLESGRSSAHRTAKRGRRGARPKGPQ